MTTTLTAFQQQRRDTASNWTNNNPTLLAGEWAYETDSKKFKIGDGSTAYTSLDYVPIPDTNRLLAGNLTVGGNFTVNGTSTTIDTTTLTVEDKNIEIGKVSSPSDTTADGGGITLKAASDKTISWSNANDSWDFNQNINAASTYSYRINNVSVLNATTLGSSVVNSSLTSLGTVATGVWQGSVIGSSYMTAGTTSVVGAVQLTDSASSTSTTTAATPNSVKTAKDAADAAQTTANGKVASVTGSAPIVSSGGTTPAISITASSGSSAGSMSSADFTKLSGIEASADVTDATNVNAAGAIMESDVDAKGDLLAGTADNTVARLAVGTDGYVLKADSSAASGLAWAVDNSGIDGSALNASNLNSGTIPDARFPATLPAISAANLTNLPASGIDGSALNASNLNSGTVPDARFPATLPAASAANLTSIPAANITGTLPAIDGSSLTGISSDFGSQNVATTGTISDGKGNVRSIPANAQGGAYVAVAADAGKAIYISTGGVTLNNSVFSAGDAVTIINNSGSNQTITQGSGVTMYNTADAATGNRTLAQRGMCTVWFAAADTAYISGAGLS